MSAWSSDGRGMASAGVIAPARSAEDSEDEPEQLQCKIILLGDGAVGKTSIALRFTEDHFATQYKQTIGLDFFMKRLVLPGKLHVRPPSGAPRSSPVPAPTAHHAKRRNNPLFAEEELLSRVSSLCGALFRRHPRRAPGVGHWRAVDRQQNAGELHLRRAGRPALL